MKTIARFKSESNARRFASERHWYYGQAPDGWWYCSANLSLLEQMGCSCICRDVP
jgi:hypothetical protein